MQYRYTLSGGYDKLIKKKVEKGTLFAVPLAVLAIVGLAALTSNTTTGPGVGSGSKGNSGQATVTKTFQPTAANDQTTAASGSTESTATGTSTQGSSGTSLAPTRSSTSSSVQPSSTTTQSTSGTSSAGTENKCICQQIQQAITPVTNPLHDVVNNTSPSLGL